MKRVWVYPLGMLFGGLVALALFFFFFDAISTVGLGFTGGCHRGLDA
jgi:hypothetical protein